MTLKHIKPYLNLSRITNKIANIDINNIDINIIDVILWMLSAPYLLVNKIKDLLVFIILKPIIYLYNNSNETNRFKLKHIGAFLLFLISSKTIFIICNLNNAALICMLVPTTAIISLWAGFYTFIRGPKDFIEIKKDEKRDKFYYD